MMAAAAAAASGEEEERTPLLLRAGLPPRRPSDDVSARRCYGAAAGLLPPRPGKLVVVVVVMVVLLLALYILLTCSSGPCRRAVLFEDHRPSMWKGGITPAGASSAWSGTRPSRWTDPVRTLTPVAPLVAAPGSGPRHGVFTVVRDKTYFYLVSELANTITGYAVTYNDNKTMSFDELFVIPTHGDDRELPEGTGAAEIHLSPDEKFLIVSSRWEYSMNITNFDASNSTDIASDPLIVYAIDRAADGGAALTKVQEFPAGGAGPRQFAVNADGDLLAVGLQADGRVVLIGRDVETGMLTNFVAYADIEGEVTAAIFHEDYHSRRVSGGRRVV
ncbi:Lactonase, 7-bladed beta-propeller-domain-containing protein [Xylariomycetidae sp. FL0641]|nr:Lactonase, 7-bladed beta-propeller-domain-containing protein [Xylariomycetidae sp. FL0641]